MPASLLQKTRGSQSSTNTPAPNADLQPITADEQNCLKQTTRGQAGVLPDESIPFVDLQNHADNPVVSTDKTGFKNYFSQNSLNRFFGWTGSAFNTYAGSAGKILPSFLDPSWLATLLTNTSAINTNKQIKLDRRWYNTTFQQGAGARSFATSYNQPNFAISLPAYSSGESFDIFFTFGGAMLLIATGSLSASASNTVKITPWYREQIGTTLNGQKKYFTMGINSGNPAVGTLPFSRFTSCIQTNNFLMEFDYKDLKVTIDSTGGIKTRLDFGFDFEVVGQPTIPTPNIPNLSQLAFLPDNKAYNWIDNNLQVDIYRG